MGESIRQQKCAKFIQKELGEIFQSDTKSLFPDAFITITRVSISPDLAIAHIYLSFLMIDKEEGISMVTDHKSEVRKILGNRIGKHMRIVPDLVFHLDEGAEHASHIQKILSKLDIPKDDEEE